MRKISVLMAFLGGLLMTLSSCNDDWVEEQYTHYVGFVAPLNDEGVTDIYVPYTRHDSAGNALYGSGISSYELPIVVSGSLTNDQEITVHTALDPDTLSTLNYARFQLRTDLYYNDMSSYVTFPETTTIEKGEDVGLLDLSFDFNGIDLSNKYVLPLTIVDDPSYNYTSNPRKNYAKAMLRVFPFNDYSGDYSATNLKVFMTGDEANASAVSTVRCYVVDDKTVFFYAGTVDEDRTDRKNYKVYMQFNGDTNGTITMWSDNDSIQLQVNTEASFRVLETEDATQPYLVHRYVIINNIDYTFSDYTSINGSDISYSAKGTLTLERQINTQIPDEDQAVEW